MGLAHQRGGILDRSSCQNGFCSSDISAISFVDSSFHSICIRWRSGLSLYYAFWVFLYRASADVSLPRHSPLEISIHFCLRRSLGDWYENPNPDVPLHRAEQLGRGSVPFSSTCRIVRRCHVCPYNTFLEASWNIQGVLDTVSFHEHHRCSAFFLWSTHERRLQHVPEISVGLNFRVNFPSICSWFLPLWIDEHSALWASRQFLFLVFWSCHGWEEQPLLISRVSGPNSYNLYLKSLTVCDWNTGLQLADGKVISQEGHLLLRN